LFQVRELSIDQWHTYWKRCPKTNLLQSWQYGTAKEQAEGWRALRFLISDHTGHPKALAQVLTRTLPLLGGIARLNRGPLFLEELSETEGAENALAALRALLREARRRRWWVMQIAPELPDSEVARQGLRGLGLRPRANAAWASGLIDLSLSEDELFGRLNRRWKRALSKASELGVTVQLEELNSSRLGELLSSYADLQQRNSFDGISRRLIDELSRLRFDGWSCDFFVAEIVNEGGGQEAIGYRICLRHGNTAIDFVVSTNEKGRQMEANSALYWKAILHARQSGCAWFDIGGLSEATPKGIAEFKQGLNATSYKLVGEWRWYYSFGPISE
jgi:lipid II:glycine glycyltransferase (peptidoglycan interpeptide bridge formation enzyme)